MSSPAPVPDRRPKPRCPACNQNQLDRIRTEPHYDSAYRISEHLYECGGCGRLWLYEKTLVCETRNRYIPRDDPDTPPAANGPGRSGRVS